MNDEMKNQEQCKRIKDLNEEEFLPAKKIIVDKIEKCDENIKAERFKLILNAVVTALGFAYIAGSALYFINRIKLIDGPSIDSSDFGITLLNFLTYVAQILVPFDGLCFLSGATGIEGLKELGYSILYMYHHIFQVGSLAYLAPTFTKKAIKGTEHFYGTLKKLKDNKEKLEETNKILDKVAKEKFGINLSESFKKFLKDLEQKQKVELAQKIVETEKQIKKLN